MFDSLNTTHEISPGVFNNDHTTAIQAFHFKEISLSAVHEALKLLDTRKSAGPDNLEPYFFKLAADFIAPPLMYLFNLSLDTNEIPLVWKSAFVLPLLKGGDPNVLDNSRPTPNYRSWLRSWNPS